MRNSRKFAIRTLPLLIASAVMIILCLSVIFPIKKYQFDPPRSYCGHSHAPHLYHCNTVYVWSHNVSSLPEGVRCLGRTSQICPSEFKEELDSTESGFVYAVPGNDSFLYIAHHTWNETVLGPRWYFVFVPENV
jgi:hypothetical protein